MVSRAYIALSGVHEMVSDLHKTIFWTHKMIL